MLNNVKENVLLSDFATYRIGGKARYFFEAKTRESLVSALKTAKELKLPVLVFGGGSNILFPDNRFNGFAIKIGMEGYMVRGDIIYAEAGMMLSRLLDIAKKNSLTGIEWTAGIPGTVGGAVFGNAQAFNKRMSDSIKSVEFLDLKSLKIKSIKKKQCKFGTKKSIFKTNKNYIILSVFLKLKSGKQREISEKIKEHIKYRNLNHPLKYYSAGSVFVNPEIKIKNKGLLKKYPELLEFNKKGFVHAGYLIEKCGLKGKRIGKAKISDMHANFIINTGGAKAKDIIKLINLAKKAVEKKFKIKLQEEVQIIKK